MSVFDIPECQDGCKSIEEHRIKALESRLAEKERVIERYREALIKIRDWNITDCKGPELRMQNERSYRLATSALQEGEGGK